MSPNPRAQPGKLSAAEFAPPTYDVRRIIRPSSPSPKIRDIPELEVVLKPVSGTLEPATIVEKKASGCFLGLAIGDAVGTTLEFSPRDTAYVETIVGGGPFRLQPGDWTDDTSQAICLCDAELKGTGVKGMLDNFVAWRDAGFYSAKPGPAFDIGIQTQLALDWYKKHKTSIPYRVDASGKDGSGNGALMRLAPVTIAVLGQPLAAQLKAIDDCTTTTHPSPLCIQSSRVLHTVLLRAIKFQGDSSPASRANILTFTAEELEQLGITDSASPLRKMLLGETWKTKSRNEISSNGFVLNSLEASFWSFYNSPDFRSAILNAVNLADDADTVGAITGQVAGAFWGLEKIPEDWLESIRGFQSLKRAAVALARKSGTAEVSTGGTSEPSAA